MTPQTNGDECFTDFALQEYLAGRLDAEVRRGLEAHLARCAECHGALQAFDTEAALLRGALATRAGEGGTEEHSDEVLARYLSGALDDSQSSALEETLSRHPALLARLVALGREVAAVREGTGQGVEKSAQRPPEGLILKMPRRTKPPLIIALPGQVGEGTGG